MEGILAERSQRIIEFDLLRGFFIFVIIVDHLQRWPSHFSYITGEGRLWVSAAEGFFIISGLLIGYLRGYKQSTLPMRSIAKLLWKRAATLYVWSVIITFIAVALVQAFHGNPTLLPKLPEVPTNSLGYIWQVLSQQYVFDWIYFLRLYWIMLAMSPLAIWALRSRWWWLVPAISGAIYWATLSSDSPEAALQWQLLFFGAATFGFKLETLRKWWHSHKRMAIAISVGLITATVATMMLSYFWVHGWDSVESGKSGLSYESYVNTRTWLDPWFSKSPLAIGRVGLAVVWFGGMLAIFHALRRPISRWLGWLLRPFGGQSLTAYCLQAVLLCLVQFWIPISTNRFINAAITIATVLLVWLLLKLPVIQKVLPR